MKPTSRPIFALHACAPPRAQLRLRAASPSRRLHAIDRRWRPLAGHRQRRLRARPPPNQPVVTAFASPRWRPSRLAGDHPVPPPASPARLASDRQASPATVPPRPASHEYGLRLNQLVASEAGAARGLRRAGRAPSTTPAQAPRGTGAHRTAHAQRGTARDVDPILCAARRCAACAHRRAPVLGCCAVLGVPSGACVCAAVVLSGACACRACACGACA